MPAVIADAVDVILRDGRTLRLRPPRVDDADALLEFFRALSEESLYLRFHGFPQVSAQLVEPLLEPDWEERGALIGALADEERDGAEEVVAVTNYVRLRDRTIAEAAFAVADGTSAAASARACWSSWRHGPRRRHRALRRGGAQPTATCSASSRPPASSASRELASGEVEVQFPDRANRALRDARGRARPPGRRGVAPAVLRAAQPGGGRRLAAAGLDRRRALPQRSRGRLRGRGLSGESGGRAGRRRAWLPVVLRIPTRSTWRSSACPPLLSSTPRRPLRVGELALIIISAGFAEVGSDGIERQERLLARPRARRTADRPNCLGIAVAAQSQRHLRGRSAPSGNIGFSSQSGALGLALLEAAEARGLGLSAFVSIGNKADVVDERPARVVGGGRGDGARAHVRRVVQQPRHFRRLARRIARRSRCWR